MSDIKVEMRITLKMGKSKIVENYLLTPGEWDAIRWLMDSWKEFK